MYECLEYSFMQFQMIWCIFIFTIYSVYILFLSAKIWYIPFSLCAIQNFNFAIQLWCV